MNAIRITQKLESETLYLPQLRPWVGREVEITVREAPLTLSPDSIQSGQQWISPLAGTVREYHDPFDSAVPPEDPK